MPHNHLWVDCFPGSIIVCDQDGIILELNETAARQYAADGGYALIGQNALDCHPEPARTRLKEMLAAGERNIYTIEKKGVKKLIYQTPWYEGERYAGFVELSLEIPVAMPHFVRGG